MLSLLSVLLSNFLLVKTLSAYLVEVLRAMEARHGRNLCLCEIRTSLLGGLKLQDGELRGI